MGDRLTLAALDAGRPLVDTCLLPVLLVSASGAPQFVNRAYHRLLSPAMRRRVRAGDLPDEAVILPRDRLMQLLALVRRVGGSRAEYLALTSPDDADEDALIERAFLLQVIPVGEPTKDEAYLVLFHDQSEEARLSLKYRELLTEHQETLSQLEATQRDRERSDEQVSAFDALKNDYLQLISEEFRTPLTAILGFADILVQQSQREKDVVDLPEIHRFASIVKEEAHRLRDNLASVLELTALEAQAVTYDRAPVNLNEIVSEVVNAQPSRAPQRSRQIDLALEADMTPAPLDRPKIALVLRHLMTMAYRATDLGGRITIATAKVERAGATAIECRIGHDGKGLTPTEIHAMFSPFRAGGSPEGAPLRAERALALPICKRVVENGHGGDMWVESPGIEAGATFAFTIPLAPRPSSQLR